MAQFNWKTDGDEAWNEGDSQLGPTPLRRRRRWPILLLVALLLSTAIFVIYDQVDERVNEATAGVTDDLMSSYTLMWYASAQDDQELFNTLLSGRDKQWTEAQRQLFDRGFAYDRPFFGIHLDDIEAQVADIAAGIEAPADIQFSADLLEAEITTELPYHVTGAAGESVSVRLRQSAIFRRGNERWLLSPPTGDYYGSQTRQERSRLTAEYPQRDAEIAARLAYELNDQLDQLCTLIADLNCPSDLRLNLRFSTDPRWLLAAGRPDSAYSRGLRLTLPTISLVGVPVDEAGYQAIYRAYARQLIAAVVAYLVDWECCDQQIFFESLLAYQLDQLGLEPWPVSDISYLQLINQGISMEALMPVWFTGDLLQLEQSERMKILILVDFLLTTYPERSAAAMQRQLVDARTLMQWLSRLYGDLIAPGENIQVITIFQEAWQQAAYRRANEAKEPAPLPLPAQQIQAGCSQDVEFETTPLYRYRFDTQAWAEISSLPGYLISMGALPDDSGALLSVVGGSNEWQTTFWRDENGIELSSDETPVLSLGQIDPTGRYALAYAMSTQGTLSQALLADLESCEAGDCSLVPVPGMAAWSPDGRHTLITGVESLGRTSLVTNRRTYWFTLATEIWPLYRGDERAQSPGELDDLVDLGPGRAPFWLDEATYGFVRSDDSSSISPAEELVVASVADDVPQVLLTASALQAALADEEYSSAWQILAGAASPSDPDLLFLSVAAVEQQDLAQVISLDRRTAQIRTRFELLNAAAGSMEFSPNGRWFVTTTPTSPDVNNGQATLFLHDVERNQTRTFMLQADYSPISMLYDWSVDGRWLAISAEDNVLDLVAPDFDYQRFLPHDFGVCTSIAWISP